jgi:hypothetical protein
MAYNPSIPQASDVPATSQGQLLANFQALQTYLSLNHEDIVGGTGKHTHVTIPVLAAPTTAAGELALYAKTVGADTELYMRRDNVATEIPVGGGTFAGTATIGYSLLPGGLKMLWGEAVTSAGGADPDGYGYRTISTAAGVFPGWPGFTINPTAQITLRNSGGNFNRNAYLYSVNLANIAVASVHTNATPATLSGSNSFTYLIIGR